MYISSPHIYACTFVVHGLHRSLLPLPMPMLMLMYLSLLYSWSIQFLLLLLSLSLNRSLIICCILKTDKRQKLSFAKNWCCDACVLILEGALAGTLNVFHHQCTWLAARTPFPLFSVRLISVARLETLTLLCGIVLINSLYRAHLSHWRENKRNHERAYPTCCQVRERETEML